jgi:hypothetical protein
MLLLLLLLHKRQQGEDLRHLRRHRHALPLPLPCLTATTRYKRPDILCFLIIKSSGNYNGLVFLKGDRWWVLPQVLNFAFFGGCSHSLHLSLHTTPVS